VPTTRSEPKEWCFLSAHDWVRRQWSKKNVRTARVTPGPCGKAFLIWRMARRSRATRYRLAVTPRHVSCFHGEWLWCAEVERWRGLLSLRHVASAVRYSLRQRWEWWRACVSGSPLHARFLPVVPSLVCGGGKMVRCKNPPGAKVALKMASRAAMFFRNRPSSLQLSNLAWPIVLAACG
jgi:hypothetical protein